MNTLANHASKFPKKPFVPKSNKNETTTVSIKNTNYNRKLKKIDSNERENTTDTGKISIGVKVKHNRFGRGEVISIEGIPPNTKAVIEFTSAGKKNLLLKFAKLEVLN